MYIVLIIAILVGEVMLANQLGKLKKELDRGFHDMYITLAENYNRLGISKRFSKESRDNTKKLLKKVDRILNKI